MKPIDPKEVVQKRGAEQRVSKVTEARNNSLNLSPSITLIKNQSIGSAEELSLFITSRLLYPLRDTMPFRSNKL
jgi:hypothetical protein